MPKELLIPEELQNPRKYAAFTRKTVSEALSRLGYGPSKKLVDSFYMLNQEKVGVGVLRITEEHCRDHFGLFRGVDQAEAIAQTFLLLQQFSGTLKEGSRPLFRKIEGFEFDLPVAESALLNLLVKSIDSAEQEFKGYGQVVVGKTVVTSGIIAGLIVPTSFVERIIERRIRIQANTQPLFLSVD